jgi:hypothetical protein
MIGVELRDSLRAPGTALADRLLEDLKDAGFLLGKTGRAQRAEADAAPGRNQRHPGFPGRDPGPRTPRRSRGLALPNQPR